MMVTVLDISMTVIAIVSILIIVLFDINRYKNGEYNPLIFRFREGSEVCFKERIAYFVLIISTIMIKNILAYFIFSLGLLSFLIVMNILNVKSYKIKKDRRIIIQTSIFDISILGALLIALPKLIRI